MNLTPVPTKDGGAVWLMVTGDGRVIAPTAALDDYDLTEYEPAGWNATGTIRYYRRIAGQEVER